MRPARRARIPLVREVAGPILAPAGTGEGTLRVASRGVHGIRADGGRVGVRMPPGFGWVPALTAADGRLRAAAASIGSAFAAYRVRVAHLMALERERMRIAIDLPDEPGSG